MFLPLDNRRKDAAAADGVVLLHISWSVGFDNTTDATSSSPNSQDVSSHYLLIYLLGTSKALLKWYYMKEWISGCMILSMNDLKGEG